MTKTTLPLINSKDFGSTTRKTAPKKDLVIRSVDFSNRTGQEDKIRKSLQTKFPIAIPPPVSDTNQGAYLKFKTNETAHFSDKIPPILPFDNSSDRKIPALPSYPSMLPSTNFRPTYIYPLSAPPPPVQAPAPAPAHAASAPLPLITPEPTSPVMKKERFKPYTCTHPGCEWAFARQSDLRRHNKSHEKPSYHCPYWRNDNTCHRNGGAFNRLDVLKRHLRSVHYITDQNNPQSMRSKDDSGWCRTCQRMFPNSKAFIEHCQECSEQMMPSKWSQLHTIHTPANEPYLKENQDINPNSNLITLSTVVDEVEGKK